MAAPLRRALLPCLAALALGAGLAGALSSCGGSDGEPAATTGLTVPAGTTTTSTVTTGTVTTETRTTTTPDDGREDTPEHDVPPPPGSPAEQFEKFCDENPEAC